MQKDDKGQQLNGKSDKVELNLTRASYDKLTKDGLVFRDSVAMVPQAKQFRVIVRDAPSGALGSVTVPLTGVLKEKASL